MSKKATRRAARDSFPKAPPPPPKRGTKYAARPTGGKYSSKSQKQRAKASGRSPGLRKPSWKRAVIWGLILAFLYFVMMHWIWAPKNAAGERTATIWGSLLISAIGFVLFALIVFFTDRFTYQRKLRKLKGGSGQQFGK